MAEEITELIGALAKAQGEFLPVIKASDNTFFKSKYADLTDVVRTIQPTLTDNGLVVSQFPSSDGQGGTTLITYLMHTSGQYIVHEMPLMLPKEDPQGQGSAITYARRYAYCAVLGVVADRDDDGNRASRPLSQRDTYDEPIQEEQDVAATDKFNELMAEAVEGKTSFGDEWANALRDQANTEGHETVNAWFRADPDAAEAFLARHKMAAMRAQSPKGRAKVGSAVQAEPSEDVQDAARRVVEAFPGAEEVPDEPALDLD